MLRTQKTGRTTALTKCELMLFALFRRRTHKALYLSARDFQLMNLRDWIVKLSLSTFAAPVKYVFRTNDFCE